jgi:glycine oxidase
VQVIVVGGGIIGRSVAWRLARAGCGVTVLDPAPERAAARVAGGMLAPVTEVRYGEEALLALNLAAARGWPRFAADLTDDAGTDPGLVRCGTLLVARDADDRSALDAVHEYQRELGLDVQQLTSRAMRQREPALGPGIRGGLFAAGDHQVHNRHLLDALALAGARHGVRVRTVAAEAVHADAVDLPDGRSLEADAVVVCAGAWSPRLLPSLAVRPVKGQILRLRATPRSVAPSHVIRGLEVYLVPRRDGELVVGATMEERGEDVTVTAGAVHDLLHAAWELVPGVAEMELAETAAGLRPATPDNQPIIGPTAEGPVVATGHHRNGILLAPITADAVVDLLTCGELPSHIKPFAPRTEAAGNTT